MRRLLLLLGLSILVALGSDRALTGAADEFVGGGDPWQFRLRFTAPEPSIQRDPGRPDAGQVLSIPTFDPPPFGSAGGAGLEAAGGQAPLPFKVVRVAIPEGASVRLEAVHAPVRLLQGYGLGSAIAAGGGPPAAGTGPTAAPGIGDGSAANAAAPPQLPMQAVAGVPVRLGSTGYFRFQKFVEVIYTPIGHVGERIEFYPEVEASLVVEGLTPAARHGSPPGTSPDPRFEEAYKRAFVNYEEGRSFRSRPGTPEGGGGELSLQATTVANLATLFPSASTPIYRIVVDATGVYRLSQSYLVAPGTGAAPGLAGSDPREFKLVGQGAEIPIRVAGESDGTFDPGDYIEFFGEGLFDEPDVVLNLDLADIGLPGFQDIYQANDVTDENVYFLFAEPGTRSRIADIAGTFNGGFPLATTFDETIRREFDTGFVPLGVGDPFFQFPALRANTGSVVPDPNQPDCGYTNPGIDPNTTPKFLGPGFAPGSIHHCPACDLSLPGVENLGTPANVRIGWRGAAALPEMPDHLVVAQVGLTPANSAAHCFDNETISEQSFTLPQSALIGQGLYLESPGLAADTTVKESAYLDYVEVDYVRTLALAGDSLLATFPNSDRSYQAGGFSSGVASDIVIYEISQTTAGTSLAAPRRVTGATIGGGSGNFSATFSLPQDGSLGPSDPQKLYMSGPGAFRTPARVEEVSGDDLLDPANEADYIVIAHPDTVDLTPGSPFQNYLAHRSSDSNLTTRVVMIQDIYDHFNNGVAAPEALRSFLSYAFDNWKGVSGTAAPPAYVMLVGDVTVDYKNNLNRGDWVNQVPTFILYWGGSAVLTYFASDNQVAAFRGNDKLPDVHLGRISVRSIAESNTVFSKLLDYDTAPPPGLWRSREVFIADQGNNAGETSEFERVQNETADTYLQPPFSNTKLFFDDPLFGNGSDTAGFRQAIINEIDAGAAATSFLGHGSFFIWGLLGYFNNGHVDLLQANDQPTFLINENCLVGGFHALAGESLGETFLKADRKGAVAVFGPAGLSFAATGERINDELYGDLFSITKERRFGHLITDVRIAIANTIVDMQSFVLLGDPAQRLILPAPRPPENFAATSGEDGQVSLSWTPSPDSGVLTNVYRATFPTGTYTLLTPSGTAGTAFVDSTVTNGETYFYRATSVEPGPFEGAPTNLNSDCVFNDPPSSGPDCRWARPLNPNPPSTPAGFQVTNPGQGDRLAVSWDAPSETDLDFYTVEYGTTPGGPYPMQATFAGNKTSGTILGLSLGVPYYMTLKATNLSGLTSPATGERSGIPGVFNGLNPPAAIEDLSLRQSPMFADAVELSWALPTMDIYGGPITAASYQIYRDTVPLYTPSPGNLIATISDPAVTEYHDRNAWMSPDDYFYLVTVTDDRGLTSGAGHELPMGIMSLDVTETGTGSLMLSWPAVTIDVAGRVTLIDHYDVYVDTSPLERSVIDMMTPVIGNVTGTSVEIPDPGSGIHFISVIVVDNRGNKSPF